MPKDPITPQTLFTAAPDVPTLQAKEQASKLMECARYLNHTGVMLGDHRMVVASHHLNTMVRVLLNQLEDDKAQAQTQLRGVD